MWDWLWDGLVVGGSGGGGYADGPEMRPWQMEK